jgi:hypothetical protein
VGTILSQAVTLLSLVLSLVSGHGVAVLSSGHTSSAAASAETIHTTANHPWLTADRGWVQAGDLRSGELLVTLSGTTSTVAWVQVVPGQADRYNLTVANDHTYAVGAGQVVVHNTDAGPCGGTTAIGPSNAKGGVYQLRDPETGRIMRTGQATNLNTRMRVHGKMYPNLDFEVVYRTDNPAELDALEQMLYDAHPEAHISQGGLNKIAPLSQKVAARFPARYARALQAGADFLERYGLGG